MSDMEKTPFWKKPKFIIGACITIFFLVILLQNWEPVILNFLFWWTPQIPLFVVMLISFVLGAIVSGLIVYLRLRRKSS